MEKGLGEKRRPKERGREKRKDTGMYVTGKQKQGLLLKRKRAERRGGADKAK